ncbi:MAG: anti-sigma F factor [Candidatus Borkfalkiaceae bacterium]|nr:anti-sigma F factor [Christensenellaceae bacterium]
MINNKMKITFLSMSQNESFARSVAGMFALSLNPSIAQVSDIKTAVSEAVTNCIVHGYPDKVGEITMESEIAGDSIHINVFDDGVGIENVKDALEPFYTTKESEERSGMGFTIMRTFMDDVKVVSEKGKGTKVYMVKKIKDDG